MAQEINIQETAGETPNRTPLTDDHNFQIPNTIPIIEEQIHITKEAVESGKVRISKKVKEVEEMVNMPISYEEHDIKRIPINKVVSSAPPAMRHDGDTMIIPVMREELVVQKRLVLVEEIHVTRRQISKTIREPVKLLKEELIIERTHNDKPVFPNDTDADNQQRPV